MVYSNLGKYCNGLMVIYSIKDLEHLTGVKAHTIRIWEKRYNIVEPQRTDTNIRYYLEKDLKHILNVALLNNNGYKISAIAAMSKDEVHKKAAQLSDFDENLESNTIDSLTMSMMEMNEFKFDRILEAHIEQLGFKRAMNEVIFPLLDKLGNLWISGCIKPVHEMFVSNVIKRKIIKAIDNVPINTDINVPSFLIFLNEKENSELSLLYLHFMLKSEGFRVTNIGKDVNKLAVYEATNILHPEYIVLIANESFADEPMEPFLTDMCKHIGDSTLLLSGYQAIKQNICSTRKVKVLSSLEEILSFCKKLI